MITDDQKLAPVWEKLGKRVQKLAEKDAAKFGNVIIAKIDATANDIPVRELVPNGYPTLKWVDANNKWVI